MKKVLIIIGIAVAFLVLSAVASNPKSISDLALSVLAGKPNPASDKGIRETGKSESEHLYLYEKNPTTWEIVEGGAWGKMNFSVGRFTFNGHGLAVEQEYSLIYYPDPWPGNGLMVLGTGVAHGDGDVNIRGSFDFAGIPIEGDENEGAKIWLVLSSDVGEGKMIGWHPAEYLFEYMLIPGSGGAMGPN